MIKRFWLCLGMLLFCAPVMAKLLPGSQQATDLIVNAIQLGQPLPLLSKSRTLSSRQAYEIQGEVVEALNGTLKADGFKAGLTTAKSQKKFAADGPVAGVLLPGSLRESRDRILDVDSGQFIRPMFEIELGFRFKQTIKKPFASLAELKSAVASLAPVVELPDLAFADSRGIKSVDIVANNVLAKQLLVGPAQPISRVATVNGINVQVYRGGKTVMGGESGAVMDNQWQALLWLVNHTVRQGYIIEPDQLCITGAISGMRPLSKGQYVADFGSLGVIRFSVR